MQNSMYTIIFLLVISYVYSGETSSSRFSATNGINARYPNSFFPSAVTLRQPTLVRPSPPVRIINYRPSLLAQPAIRHVEPKLVTCKIESNVDRQIQTYIAGFEALTSTIQELDEAVQSMRSCDYKLTNLSPPNNLLTSPHQIVPEITASPTSTTNSVTIDRASSSTNEVSATTVAPVGETLATTAAPVQVTSSTTAAPVEETSSTGTSISAESATPTTVASLDETSQTEANVERVVTDTTPTVSPIDVASPVENTVDSGLSGTLETSTSTTPATVIVETLPTETTVSTTTESFTDAPTYSENVRRRRDGTHFGLPSLATPDQSKEDLAKASAELKALHKDLGKAADWMKQTNYTIHSVMLKALQAYVTSIERRVDHERQLNTSTKGVGLLLKIGLIKEKVAVLLEKLKTLIPFRQTNISRDDRGSLRGIVTTAAGTFNNIVPTTVSSNTVSV